MKLLMLSFVLLNLSSCVSGKKTNSSYKSAVSYNIERLPSSDSALADSIVNYLDDTKGEELLVKIKKSLNALSPKGVNSVFEDKSGDSLILLIKEYLNKELHVRFPCLWRVGDKLGLCLKNHVINHYKYLDKNASLEKKTWVLSQLFPFSNLGNEYLRDKEEDELLSGISQIVYAITEDDSFYSINNIQRDELLNKLNIFFARALESKKVCGFDISNETINCLKANLMAYLANLDQSNSLHDFMKRLNDIKGKLYPLAAIAINYLDNSKGDVGLNKLGRLIHALSSNNLILNKAGDSLIQAIQGFLRVNFENAYVCEDFISDDLLDCLQNRIVDYYAFADTELTQIRKTQIYTALFPLSNLAHKYLGDKRDLNTFNKIADLLFASGENSFSSESRSFGDGLLVQINNFYDGKLPSKAECNDQGDRLIICLSDNLLLYLALLDRNNSSNLREYQSKLYPLAAVAVNYLGDSKGNPLLEKNANLLKALTKDSDLENEIGDGLLRASIHVLEKEFKVQNLCSVGHGDFLIKCVSDKVIELYIENSDQKTSNDIQAIQSDLNGM